jgi:hypothetical protein
MQTIEKAIVAGDFSLAALKQRNSLKKAAKRKM